jgi:hypothetical protein
VIESFVPISIFRTNRFLLSFLLQNIVDRINRGVVAINQSILSTLASIEKLTKMLPPDEAMDSVPEFVQKGKNE